jgi:hypothetical protein
MDYLTDSPFRIIERFDFKVSDILRDSQYSNKAGEKLKKAKNGIYLPIEMAEIRKPHQIANKFRGKVFLLISQGKQGRCFTFLLFPWQQRCACVHVCMSQV